MNTEPLLVVYHSSNTREDSGSGMFVGLAIGLWPEEERRSENVERDEEESR
jgi:hypothetical protein